MRLQKASSLSKAGSFREALVFKTIPKKKKSSSIDLMGVTSFCGALAE